MVQHKYEYKSCIKLLSGIADTGLKQLCTIRLILLFMLTFQPVHRRIVNKKHVLAETVLTSLEGISDTLENLPFK